MQHKLLLQKLNHDPLRKTLISHPLLLKMRTDRLSKIHLELILGQWYHPLHYFPTFLSYLIALADKLEIKTLISKILWQELGEGDVTQAHETIFINTLLKSKFTKSQFVNIKQLDATKNLLEGYKKAGSQDYLTALGFVFGTEAADLAMVGAIGSAIKNTTGVQELEWVSIHVKQEPDHTDCVAESILVDMSEIDATIVLMAARQIWALWIDFFDNITQTINSGVIEVVI